LPERREPLSQFRIFLRQGDHYANLARLLRARRERLSGCSAVEQRDERASFHSHLVGVLSSRERIAHLGGAGDPALRNFSPAYVSLGQTATCLPKSAMSVVTPLTEAARALPEAF
jgi:hypothetical protein